MNSSPISADDEARRIHQAIFGRAASDILNSRYSEACLHLEGLNSPEQLELMKDILARVRDLEALEVAARWRGRLSPLVLRFQLMVRLAETLPGNRGRFINLRQRRIAGWMAAASGGLRTAYKLMKGLYLLRRFRRA